MAGVNAHARRRSLLTGVSGAGKSSVTVRLTEFGYVAIDADAPEYSAEVPAPADELTGIGPGRDRVWQEEAIRAVAVCRGDALRRSPLQELSAPVLAQCLRRSGPD